jgi:hypothetical protein
MREKTRAKKAKKNPFLLFWRLNPNSRRFFFKTILINRIGARNKRKKALVNVSIKNQIIKFLLEGKKIFIERNNKIAKVPKMVSFQEERFNF